MMFREDIRTETLTRQNWRDLIKIKTDEPEHNFLDKYMLLTYEDLVGAKKLRKSKKMSTSRNMYITIWRTLSPAPKQKFCSYLYQFNDDCPTLLWYIVTLYHGTAAQIIRTQRKNIYKFNNIVRFHRGDIEKVCESMQNTIQSLLAAGGTDEQAFGKMYAAFTETQVPKFNQEMQVWKSVAELSSNPAKQSSPTTILQKARELYQELGVQKKWPEYVSNHHGQNSRKRSRTEDLTDVAALIAQNKSFKKYLNTIKSGLSGGKALRSNGSTRRGGRYSWENHYDPDKDFSTKGDFFTWLHRKPNNTTTSETKNGID